MAKNKHDIEINTNKEIAGVAAFACAVGFGTASAVFGIFNFIFVAGGAGVIGYVAGIADKTAGVIATVIAVIIFFVALNASGAFA